jgi:putative colanic acid biosynthesis acetyltransferase WcaF
MNTTDLSIYDNAWFSPKAGFLKRTLWFYVNLIFFKNDFLPFNAHKISLLRFFGAKIGNGVVIKPAVNIKYPWLLEIGDFSWIGEEVWIDNLTHIKIGKHCCLSQGAMLLTGNHNYKKVSFDLMVGSIVLEDGVWIGAKAMVCPNVTAKSHAVLSAMSVATKDLDAFGIYQGSPAQWIKKRDIS